MLLLQSFIFYIYYCERGEQRNNAASQRSLTLTCASLWRKREHARLPFPFSLEAFSPTTKEKKKKSNFQVQSNSWQTVTLPQKSSQSSHWGLVSCVDLLAVLVQRPSSQRKAGKFHSHLSLRRTWEENDNEFDFCFLFTKWRSLPQQYEEAKRTCICHWETCFRIWCNIWL